MSNTSSIISQIGRVAILVEISADVPELCWNAPQTHIARQRDENVQTRQKHMMVSVVVTAVVSVERPRGCTYAGIFFLSPTGNA